LATLEGEIPFSGTKRKPIHLRRFLKRKDRAGTERKVKGEKNVTCNKGAGRRAGAVNVLDKNALLKGTWTQAMRGGLDSYPMEAGAQQKTATSVLKRRGRRGGEQIEDFRM